MVTDCDRGGNKQVVWTDNGGQRSLWTGVSQFGRIVSNLHKQRAQPCNLTSQIFCFHTFHNFLSIPTICYSARFKWVFPYHRWWWSFSLWCWWQLYSHCMNACVLIRTYHELTFLQRYLSRNLLFMLYICFEWNILLISSFTAVPIYLVIYTLFVRQRICFHSRLQFMWFDTK